MARQQGTLLLNGSAYSEQSFSPVVNLQQGGQFGFIPDFTTFLSNSAYVQRPVIPFLLEYPRGFDYLPQPKVWIGTLKALIETQSKLIDGLQGGITLNFIENPFGASGEQQEDFSQIQRARSQPKHTWVERQGRPIHNFFNGWVFYLIAHPDTQTPMINSIEENKDKYFDFLPDFNSMTVLYVEPDPFQRRVEEAWLCMNMMPKSTGPLEGKRDLPSAMSGRDVDIEFTAITMMSLGVKQFAQSLLNRLNYAGLNPQNRRSAIEDVQARIRDAMNEETKRSIGYEAQVTEVATTQNYNRTSITPKPVHKEITWELSRTTK